MQFAMPIESIVSRLPPPAIDSCTHEKKSALTAPEAAAMVVVMAAFDAAKMSSVDVKPTVEPELNPYHPTQRMSTPLKTAPTSCGMKSWRTP